MPAGAGRKGGKVAKKKAPKKRTLTDENRIPLNITPCPSTESIGSASPVKYNVQVTASGKASVTTHNGPSQAVPFCWQGPSTSTCPPYHNPSWMYPPPSYPWTMDGQWTWPMFPPQFPLATSPGPPQLPAQLPPASCASPQLKIHFVCASKFHLQWMS